MGTEPQAAFRTTLAAEFLMTWELCARLLNLTAVFAESHTVGESNSNTTYTASLAIVLNGPDETA